MRTVDLFRVNKLLGAALLTVTLGCFAYAADVQAATPVSGSCSDQITWSMDSNGVLTITGSGNMDECFGEGDSFASAISEEITEVKVMNGITSICNYAFLDCENLKSVTLPTGITRIGCSAFRNCYSLKEIILPDTISYIGSSAFENTYKLDSIALPAGIDTITFSLLRNSGIQSVVIPEGIKTIDGWAFRSCLNLKKVVLPSTIDTVDDEAFRACEDLEIVLAGSVNTPTVPGNEEETLPITGPSALAEAYRVDTTTSTSGEVRLNWKKVKGASKYVVYYRSNSSDSWKSITTTRALTYTGKGLCPDSACEFYVSCVNSKNCEIGINQTLAAIAAPELTNTVSENSRTLKVEWNQVPEAAGYQIQIATNTKFKSAKTITVKSNSAAAKVISKLKSGKNYSVRIRSYSYNGKKKCYSPWSAILTTMIM